MAILAALVYRFGAEPFLDGLRQTDAGALLVALVITAVTTACCARRWSLLAEGLEVSVPFRASYRACYRAQFLNATLPGGILGDVHRGIRHGRDTGAMARALRSVVWDRVAGQLVQAVLAVGALLLFAPPVRAWELWLLLGIVLVAAVGRLVLLGGILGPLRAEIRAVLGGTGVAQRVVLLSAAAAAGHVVVFVVAARTAGVSAPLQDLVPLGFVVLMASAIPMNVAGWGPREGAAAWVFGASGLGASAGLQVAVVYGVMALVATLPGALLWGPASPRPAEYQTRGGSAWATGPTSS